jgi:hypothetical protein
LLGKVTIHVNMSFFTIHVQKDIFDLLEPPQIPIYGKLDCTQSAGVSLTHSFAGTCEDISRFAHMFQAHPTSSAYRADAATDRPPAARASKALVR